MNTIYRFVQFSIFQYHLGKWFIWQVWVRFLGTMIMGEAQGQILLDMQPVSSSSFIPSSTNV